jgi:DNA (cytosine-5)-methyltransferase 1
VKHLDLFSGIGGFAYAADQVFGDVEHIFCDNDKFCRAILNKHWPESEVYEDIRFITDTDLKRRLERQSEIDATERDETQSEPVQRVDLLTGGFPCQPFSHAGARRGTSDDRYLWPEMLRVIRLAQPAWIIAENVSGLVTWNDGMVLERVCADMEAAGYEVQPFIIPAAAVNAPHRRDRVWFVANTIDERRQRSCYETVHRERRLQKKLTGSAPDWSDGWTIPEPHCVGIHDGIPHRTHRIKALGNAIVPQVAMQIMEAIKLAQSTLTGKEK